jgi:8-oxo-dGTP diphosphatase
LLGSWQFPGGHLEFHEEILACAEREAEEETGLKVKGLKIATVTNDIFTNDKKHYITLFVHCGMLDPNAEPKVRLL